MDPEEDEAAEAAAAVATEAKTALRSAVRACDAETPGGLFVPSKGLVGVFKKKNNRAQ